MSEHKFKVGDKVIIDNVISIPGDPGSNQEMKLLLGKVGTVVRLSTYVNVEVDGQIWAYHPSWLKYAESKKPSKKVKIQIKTFSEILDSLVRGDFTKDGLTVTKEMFKLAGTHHHVSIEIDSQNQSIGFLGHKWHPDWLNLPKNFKMPEKRFRADLCSYTVDTEAEVLNVGCQTITKEQELKWFKVLGRRLGYEIKE